MARGSSKQLELSQARLDLESPEYGAASWILGPG